MDRSPIRSFRDLDAWNIAMALAVACYSLTRRLPVEERFGLSAQMRRAAVSVPSNIAEGHSSGSDGLFGRHVRTALGSVGELETHVELALRIGSLQKADVEGVMQQLARTGQVLQGLARSIRTRRLKRGAGGATLLAVLWLLAFF